MEEKIDDADAYERRDTVIVSGKAVPTVTDGESCLQIVSDLLKNELKLIVPATDISTAHRLGKRPATQQPDNRSIIVKLCRRDLKKDILDACRQLKPEMYVNESLTPTRNTIMYVLRKAKRKCPDKISGCISIDGRVCVFVKPPNPDAPGARNSRMFVNTPHKLELFCHDILETPLATFIENLPKL